ncbi:MAG: site-specific integrase [Alistipes sp.]|nr:site-specific integrase [Alistipes sp.]
MATPKDPIRLRQRKRDSGRVSLYLDIYVKGKRKCEALNLYLEPGDSREIKEYNRQQLALADTIRAQRLIELRNRRYNLNDEGVASPYLLDYYMAVFARKSANWTTNTMLVWRSAYNYLRDYQHANIAIDEIDKYWVTAFVEWLSDKMAVNTARLYLTKYNAMFRQAVTDGIILRNPMDGAEKPKGKDSEREYLTIDEVRAMAATDCNDYEVKRAFLFSCLTGLRYSDIVALRWCDVRQQGQFIRLVYRQQKTGKHEHLDISPQAVQYMGVRGGDNEPIFRCHRACNDKLREWAKAAGITKHITFHSGRHTFAVMMIDLGTDIYTVSKMLGHKDIKTTQIYADLLDKRKQEAVLRIPEI